MSQLGGKLLVGSSHVLAVSAPGREKLDQDQRELVECILKCLIGEDKDMAFNLIIVADSVIVVVSFMAVIVVVMVVVVMLMIVIMMSVRGDQRDRHQA